MAVYGLLLIASNLLMADMARLHTYIRPLKLAYVDAIMGAVAYHRNKESQGVLLAGSGYKRH
jgi:hypothetical protein